MGAPGVPWGNPLRCSLCGVSHEEAPRVSPGVSPGLSPWGAPQGFFSTPPKDTVITKNKVSGPDCNYKNQCFGHQTCLLETGSEQAWMQAPWVVF